MMIRYDKANVDGVNLFYREAGRRDRPTLVLLHGFPSSSHMFRNLIPALADRFHVIAPDYPGFGNSDAPSPTVFSYTFDRISELVEGLLEQLGVGRFGLFVQDYGSPVGFRIATRHPEAVEWIVCQNGNAYEEGFTGFWNHLREQYWNDPSPATEAPLRDFLTPEAAVWIYSEGTRDPNALSPDNWNMDIRFLVRPEADRIQLDLFYDYRTNVELYPVWQEYLRTHRPPTLVVWGKNDPIFTPEGAMAFGRDLPDAEIHLLDTGHFALEEDLETIVELMQRFYLRKVSGAATAAA